MPVFSNQGRRIADRSAGQTNRRRNRPKSTQYRRKLLNEQLEQRCVLSAISVIDGPPAVPGELLIGYRPGLAEDEMAAVTRGNEIQELRSYSAGEEGTVSHAKLISVPAEMTDHYLSELLHDPRVAYVEPNYIVRAQVEPNDSLYTQLWGLNNEGQTGGLADADIDAPEAWNLATGSTAVVVGVVDTGVDYTHPDLYLNIWLNQGEIPTIGGARPADVDGDGRVTFYDLNDVANADFSQDLNGNGYIDAGDLLRDVRWADNTDGPDPGSYVDDLIGWDFAQNDNDPLDDHGHGTHVSGTLGATGDNITGIVGVNWRTQIMPLKFLAATGAGATSDAIAAIDYATTLRATLTNNSWGGGGFSAGLQAAIAASGNANLLFVAAAGNDGLNNDFTPTYPASYNLANIVSVAASDHNDALASFSNFGNGSVDVAAPGVSVFSTTPNVSYSTFNGTSMATPHVTGIAALAWSVEPDASYQEVRAALLEGSDEIASLDNFVGTSGRVNAAQTLRLINPNGSTLRLDRVAYSFPATIEITVFDTDPDRNPLVRDTVTVSAVSTTESIAETVVLTETGPSTKVFIGAIQLAAAPDLPGDGKLQVAHNDRITVSYLDANPGSGPGLVTATAVADNVRPAIEQVLSAPGARRATILWKTNELSDSVVRYGVNPDNLDQTASSRGLTAAHSVTLFGLADETTYYYEVSSADAAGNRVTERGHSLVTLAAPPILFVDDDQGVPLEAYFTAALDAGGYVYAVWDVDAEGRAPTALELADHSTVVWNTGANYEAATAGLTPSEEGALRSFLDTGGNLFLAGQDILFKGVSSTFLNDYLHVSDFQEDVPLNRVLGSVGDPIGDGLSLPITLPPPFEEDFADRLIPDEFAAGSLFAANSDGAPADVAVRYPSAGESDFKTVFFAFPFESISTTAEDPNNQAIVMERVLTWLGHDAPGRPGFTIDPISGLRTSERGGSDSFTVAVKTVPTADVLLTITTTDPSEGLLSAGGELTEQITLTFTVENWNIPQTVTITGVDDQLADGDREFVLVTDPAVSTDPAYAGVDPLNLSIKNLDDRPFAVQGTVADVGNDGWTEVVLPHVYESMVVVATPNYGAGSPAGVVRIQNAAGDRFQVRVDSTTGLPISSVVVHYLVMEEGAYNEAEHGLTAEARKFDSTVTDGGGSWFGESQEYHNLYDSPVVLGQVMTYNDPEWSVFWSSSVVAEDPPDQFLRAGKHAGEDPDLSRADETIGYLVFESGTGSLGGFNYTAALGADTIFGVDSNIPSAYPLSGLSSVGTAIAIQAGMDGWDGGWAVLYGPNPVSVDSLRLSIDEDQHDAERQHTNEQVAYIVFEREPNLPPEIDLDADNSSGAAGTGYHAKLLFSRDTTLAADTDASLSDATSNQLAALTATITNLRDGEEESLFADVTGTALVSSYDAEAGELTLSGLDSVTNYESVLRTVTYQNTAANRDPAQRNVVFRAYDGHLWSEPARSLITFAAPNIPPAAHPGGPYSIQRGQTLLLNGSLSIDSDAGPFPLVYEWDVNYDGTFTADTAGRVVTVGWGQLQQKGIQQGGNYTVALRVFDGEHYSLETTRLSVDPNRPPIVQTGGPYAIQPGWTLFLNSLGSYDPEGGASVLKVEWDLNYDGDFKPDAAGAAVPFSWSKLQQLGIKAGESFRVAVRASDGTDTTLATTQVTVGSNQPPFARTGGPYVTQPGWTVFLRATGSFDPDFGPSPLSYEWDLNYDGTFKPDLTGSVVTATWGLLIQHGMEPGKTYSVALRVSDGASSAVSLTTLRITGPAAGGPAPAAAADALEANGQPGLLPRMPPASMLFDANEGLGDSAAAVAAGSSESTGIDGYFTSVAAEQAAGPPEPDPSPASLDWLDDLYDEWSWIG